MTFPYYFIRNDITGFIISSNLNEMSNFPEIYTLPCSMRNLAASLQVMRPRHPKKKGKGKPEQVQLISLFVFAQKKKKKKENKSKTAPQKGWKTSEHIERIEGKRASWNKLEGMRAMQSLLGKQSKAVMPPDIKESCTFTTT